MHDIPEAATVKPPQQNSTSPILPEGYLLRDYKIIKMLGHGAFGITYLAQEDITDKRVVIKENYPTTVSFRDMASLTVGPLTDNHKETYDWALTRFLDEAKTLSRLSHPNIVPIRYAFKALGTAYYVMPHVEGTELNKAAPAPDTITAEWLLPMLEKILHALNYLHEQKIIHRDIKPNNILICANGEPVLIDFGTARTLENTLSHTQIGTPGFMPLEQCTTKGKRGPWTDFYALGATCYHLITGEIPPSSTERADEDEYIPLTVRPSLAKRFPEHVLSSIDKALSMKRSERWQSAQEWLEALKDKASSPSDKLQPNTPPFKAIIAIILFILFIISFAYTGGIHIAINNNSPSLLRACLCLPGIDVNNRFFDDMPPLSKAIIMDSRECVRLLLAAPGIDVNQIEPGMGLTPLHVAVEYGNVECVKLLLAASGIDVNRVDKEGWTPLHFAVTHGRTKCLKLLLAAPGINVNLANKNGKTPLSYAEEYNLTECARLIREAGGRR